MIIICKYLPIDQCYQWQG